ncbi:hypothetical protein F383_06914 [Gossypium arboreum]|uniref:Uncharacterized protein n=1 Tax=Gossypium arboreum TaxID=29729 RepID=A0A0B0P8K4_GOSAR|nr:hypothetical protein F383_06914 [Gossypium arboreum]
MAQLKILEKI